MQDMMVIAACVGAEPGENDTESDRRTELLADALAQIRVPSNDHSSTESDANFGLDKYFSAETMDSSPEIEQNDEMNPQKGVIHTNRTTCASVMG